MDTKNKAIFFDIDGVLSVPIYSLHTKQSDIVVPCIPNSYWSSYCLARNNERLGAYTDCKPLPYIVDFVKQLAAEDNIYLYTLSTEQDEIAKEAKITFIEEYYPDCFEQFLFVNTDDEKLTIMQEYCKRLGISTANGCIIEDTYSTIINICDKGFKGLHITNLLLEEPNMKKLGAKTVYYNLLRY